MTLGLWHSSLFPSLSMGRVLNLIYPPRMWSWGLQTDPTQPDGGHIKEEAGRGSSRNTGSQSQILDPLREELPLKSHSHPQVLCTKISSSVTPCPSPSSRIPILRPHIVPPHLSSLPWTAHLHLLVSTLNLVSKSHCFSLLP